MSAVDAPAASPPVVTVRALFERFLVVGLSGFGGVLPFARRMLVDQCRWLTEIEFAEILAMSQFLPGPNIVNVSVIVGRKFQGARGALAAILGLLLMPMAIVMLLGALYAHYAEFAVVRAAMGGVAAAASGLVLAMGIRMARTIRRSPPALAIACVAFMAIAIMRWPLTWVLAVLAPLSVAYYWHRRR